MTTAREIRRRFNNNVVAEAIATRAAEDFLLCYPSEKLSALREELKERRYYPYPLIGYPEMAVLCAKDNAWTGRPLKSAILTLFKPDFTSTLTQAGLKLDVKLDDKVAVGVYIVPSK